jgi:type III secretion system YscD/HrpQ family protein
LKSRNGTLIDGESVTSKKKLMPNEVVSVGTTIFTVYDREGEMQTIISPLLPAIVKVLQKDEELAPPSPAAAAPIEVPKVEETPSPIPVNTGEKSSNALGAFIVVGIISGLFAIIGLGTASLFRGEPIQVEQQTNPSTLIQEALAPFPSIKHYYNPSTGTLQLIGHVASLSEKSQLEYSLQGLNFLRNIDSSSVIIDQFVLQDINQDLSGIPLWRGITVISPQPGKFILTGALQTRQQFQQLSQYLSNRFYYLDLLEKQVIVEEDVVSEATTILQSGGLNGIGVQISNRELTLTGGIPASKQDALKEAIAALKQITGVRDVKNFVSTLAPEASVINISDKYEVTGVSRQGQNFSVVVRGRILSQGDELDGMVVKEIRSNTIFLEKDGVSYRINF